MGSFIRKYSCIFKIGLCFFLTIGCNLSIEGHFLPNSIYPYIFFILNAYVVFNTDWYKIKSGFMQSKTKIYVGIFIIACILLQAIILRFNPAVGMTGLAKISSKILICAVSTAIISLLSLFKFKDDNITILHVFYICGTVYLFLMKWSADSFGTYPFLLLMLVYLSSERAKYYSKAKGKIYFISNGNALIKICALCLALFETLGYLTNIYQKYDYSTWVWFGLVVMGTIVWTYIIYYVLCVLFRLFDDMIVYMGKVNCSADVKTGGNAGAIYLGGGEG